MHTAAGILRQLLVNCMGVVGIQQLAVRPAVPI